MNRTADRKVVEDGLRYFASSELFRELNVHLFNMVWSADGQVVYKAVLVDRWTIVGAEEDEGEE